MDEDDYEYNEENEENEEIVEEIVETEKHLIIYIEKDRIVPQKWLMILEKVYDVTIELNMFGDDLKQELEFVLMNISKNVENVRILLHGNEKYIEWIIDIISKNPFIYSLIIVAGDYYYIPKYVCKGFYEALKTNNRLISLIISSASGSVQMVPVDNITLRNFVIINEVINEGEKRWEFNETFAKKNKRFFLKSVFACIDRGKHKLNYDMAFLIYSYMY